MTALLNADAWTADEYRLLIEALAIAASRRESQARALKPGAFATFDHDEKAARMRKLRARLMKSIANSRSTT